MANTSKICGLRPINPVIRANVYKHVTGLEVYMNQPAKLNGSGYAEQALFNGTSAGGQALVGSVVGFLGGDWAPESSSYSGYLPVNPTSADSNGYVNVLIADSPDQLFVIEEDTGGTALTQAACFLGSVMDCIGTTGSTISGVASAVLDRSKTLTAPMSNLTLQLIKKWDKPDNAYGDYCKWIVRINDHQYQRASGVIDDKSTLI